MIAVIPITKELLENLDCDHDETEAFLGEMLA
jgi:hypothetical protein